VTAPSYRLDSVAAALIERLEGARPSWQGDPDAARAGFSRIVDETLDAAIAEYDDVLGGGPQAEILRRELTTTFLPRYTRLALEQSVLEIAGYRAWRRGDPVARVLGGVGGLLFALLAVEVLHNPVAVLAFLVPLIVPFIPELRRAWFRRAYRAQLQAAVDDLSRIQDELERYAAPQIAAPLAQETPQ